MLLGPSDHHIWGAEAREDRIVVTTFDKTFRSGAESSAGPSAIRSRNDEDHLPVQEMVASSLSTRGAELQSHQAQVKSAEELQSEGYAWACELVDELVELMVVRYVQVGSGSVVDDITHLAQQAYSRLFPPRLTTTEQELQRPRRQKSPSSARTLALLGIRCARCGSTDRVVLDHVVYLPPATTGTEGNVQPLCTPCNSRKGAR